MQHSNEVVEEWRTIEGFENYEVSNLGRVRRVEYIKQREDFNGYPIVNLYKGGEGKTAKVHRLVAQAFIPNPDNLSQVNHKNENKADNRVINLEWCSLLYNVRYGTGIERRSHKRTLLRNGTSSKSVIQYDLQGNYIAEYPSAKEAARRLSLKISSNITRCCKNQRKTAYSFKWKYKN